MNLEHLLHVRRMGDSSICDETFQMLITITILFYMNPFGCILVNHCPLDHSCGCNSFGKTVTPMMQSFPVTPWTRVIPYEKYLTMRSRSCRTLISGLRAIDLKSLAHILNKRTKNVTNASLIMPYI